MQKAALSCLCLAVLAVPMSAVAADDPALDRLADWMTGSFSSAAQADADPDFRHIVLHMVRIWPDRSDGVWLYVEQAVAEAADRPYRQRVYRVRRVGEDLFASSVFTLSDPQAFVGARRHEQPLAALGPGDLTPREGCTIYLLERADGSFEGSTLGRLCRSTLRGATWASSEVVIDSKGMTSWDRGWNDVAEQVWGAEKAGYRFDRVDAPSETAASIE
jgi:hypothetical protein